MDKIEIKAAATRPVGHIKVKSGVIRPDDLIYSWPTGEWLPASSPLWMFPSENLRAEDCVFVARFGQEPDKRLEKKPDTQENIGPLHLVDKREGQGTLFS